MQLISTPDVVEYDTAVEVPDVPRELWHREFLILYRSRPNSKRSQVRIATYKSSGWLYLDKLAVVGYVHGWSLLE